MSRIRVYRYGLLPPTENADKVRDIMRLAHAYGNRLVEIERGRRATERSMYERAGDIAALRARLDEVKSDLDALVFERLRINARTRSKARISKEMRDNEKRVRLAVREARAAVYAANKRLREEPSFQQEREALFARTNVDCIAAYAQSGLTTGGAHPGAWATCNLAKASKDQAFKIPLYNRTEPKDPRFQSFSKRRRHRVGVQLQGGLDVADVFRGSDSQIRIDPVDEAAWYDRSGGAAREPGCGKRAKMRTTLRMRIESEGRAPVWASWPMIMHRPIPDGAKIKGAFVTVERNGPFEAWYVCLTADLSAVPRRKTCGSGRASVAFGWKVMPEGALRVAAIADDAGRGEAFSLPPDLMSGFDKLESLGSIRSTNFNVALAALTSWLGTSPHLPAWWTERAGTVSQWESPARLAGLARFWRDNRFDADEDAYVALEAWRYKDDHLWRWESGQRRKIHLRRREMYRIVAKGLATRYGHVVLGDFDRRDVAIKSSDKYENATARRNRQRACTSDFENAIVQAMTSAGGKVSYVEMGPIAGTVTGPDGHTSKGSGAGATHECHACGYPNDFDAATVSTVCCGGCGVQWQHDLNCARNLLKRDNVREQSGGAQEPDGARVDQNDNEIVEVYEGRFARAKRKKADREAANKAARNANDSAAE